MKRLYTLLIFILIGMPQQADGAQLLRSAITRVSSCVKNVLNKRWGKVLVAGVTAYSAYRMYGCMQRYSKRAQQRQEEEQMHQDENKGLVDRICALRAQQYGLPSAQEVVKKNDQAAIDQAQNVIKKDSSVRVQEQDLIRACCPRLNVQKLHEALVGGADPNMVADADGNGLPLRLVVPYVSAATTGQELHDALQAVNYLFAYGANADTQGHLVMDRLFAGTRDGRDVMLPRAQDQGNFDLLRMMRFYLPHDMRNGGFYYDCPQLAMRVAYTHALPHGEEGGVIAPDDRPKSDYQGYRTGNDDHVHDNRYRIDRQSGHMHVHKLVFDRVLSILYSGDISESVDSKNQELVAENQRAASDNCFRYAKLKTMETILATGNDAFERNIASMIASYACEPLLPIKQIKGLRSLPSSE